MAFFSGSRRGTAGGGGGGGIFGPQSLLPTSSSSSSSRPKPSRSASRRRGLLSPSTSTFFLLGLSLSLLLFLAVVLRYGVPNPLSSSSRHHLRPRRPNIRRPATNADVISSASGRSGREIASVDITTKDLYDRIEFLDVDGGPWKQGWRVSYVGNEWDEEKLKVFVVPHSHNDPGWKLTVEEYYERQSRRILDTIVEALSKDERRKFIWEEMSYLTRWWRDSTKSKREEFVRLVKRGQLEIVGGGWVMNDEVKCCYF